MKKYAVIVAGGTGTRMGGDTPKQFLEVDGTPVLLMTLARFYEAAKDIHLIVVLPATQLGVWESLYRESPCIIPHEVTAGGATRTESVINGLALVPEDALVAIHDGVRPFVAPELVNTCFRVAQKKGSAVAAVSLKDSLRKVTGSSNRAVNREDHYLVQTPQCFPANALKAAYKKTAMHKVWTDDASVMEAAGHTIHLVEGDYRNIKITTPEDLLYAKAISRSEK